ncbi:unnamed protein product [Nippostrongylus brasiliensis]|uniref:Peptidase A2 domain-containing protein n=1 Tax=Nippostrongylus brasiliensis TaxID=27835 RepID=A0A158R0Z2_NIPBR|nr:unnamed protein product [Nippostrongylus brasiliensis]
MVKSVFQMTAEYGSYRTPENPYRQSFSEIGDPGWTTQVAIWVVRDYPTDNRFVFWTPNNPHRRTAPPPKDLEVVQGQSVKEIIVTFTPVPKEELYGVDKGCEVRACESMHLDEKCVKKRGDPGEKKFHLQVPNYNVLYYVAAACATAAGMGPFSNFATIQLEAPQGLGDLAVSSGFIVDGVSEFARPFMNLSPPVQHHYLLVVSNKPVDSALVYRSSGHNNWRSGPTRTHAMDQLANIIAVMQQQMQLIQQQQQESTENFMRMLEKIEARTALSSSIVVKDKHSIFDSLYRRIEKFVFDAENGRTFDVWFKRFKDVFDNDCGDLDDKEKTRLLVSRLDEDCHQLFCGSISPRLPSDLSWDEALATLERLFGSSKTLFRRRFECFKIQYDHQNFTTYETLVRTRCADAKLDSIDFDGLQCLVYVAGFQGAEFADYRTRLLRKLDQAEKLSIKDLTAECQLIKSYKEDARMLENAAMRTPTINFVSRKKFRSRQRQRRDKNESASGDHQRQRTPSHPRRRNPGGRSYQMKSIIAALQKDAQPHLEVVVNGRPLSLLLDTGAMITMISRSNWKRLGKPPLSNSDTVINAANGSRIDTDGRFEAEFMLKKSDGYSHSGRGLCYVNEKLDVFGWEWIQQVPDLLRPLQNYINSHNVIVDLVAHRGMNIILKWIIVWKNGSDIADSQIKDVVLYQRRRDKSSKTPTINSIKVFKDLREIIIGIDSIHKFCSKIKSIKKEEDEQKEETMKRKKEGGDSQAVGMALSPGFKFDLGCYSYSINVTFTPGFDLEKATDEVCYSPLSPGFVIGYVAIIVLIMSMICVYMYKRKSRGERPGRVPVAPSVMRLPMTSCLRPGRVPVAPSVKARPRRMFIYSCSAYSLAVTVNFATDISYLLMLEKEYTLAQCSTIRNLLMNPLAAQGAVDAVDRFTVIFSYGCLQEKTIISLYILFPLLGFGFSLMNTLVSEELLTDEVCGVVKSLLTFFAATLYFLIYKMVNKQLSKVGPSTLASTKLTQDRYYKDRAIVSLFAVCSVLPLVFAIPTILLNIIESTLDIQSKVVDIGGAIFLDLAIPSVWSAYILYIPSIRHGLRDMLFVTKRKSASSVVNLKQLNI